ncbi:hypothetical protein QNO07_00590 [Streptomyces sp. 549]|uniref:hypothetical protein n=1 Tax=Streptomyces sp. 549 TaxID=3049076 RepID=UPI0024C21BF6|nr:hypothetical protein [Streptomyces sp. 549]MDK1471936.1 hypothetical protein [Streptomyces sp. 549]
MWTGTEERRPTGTPRLMVRTGPEGLERVRHREGECATLLPLLRRAAGTRGRVARLGGLTRREARAALRALED